MGRGVLREEPAIHFSGRHRLVGSAVSTSKEPSPVRATFASSRAVHDGHRATLASESVHSPYRLLAGENIGSRFRR
jgi:hypothetical protein